MFRQVQKEQLRVPARIEFLGALRDFVTKVGHRHGFSERVINAFKLSIDEAATNIIKHAYRDLEGDITIRAIVKKNSLTIVLIDQGKYFDPRQVSDPDLQRYVDIGKKGGLGIFIMRRLLDEIDYRKTEEGNELWMVKYRDVARRRKITVPSIPMTLKARYWLVSTGIFTIVLSAIYFYTFFRRDNVILKDYLDRGRTACNVLVSDLRSNFEELTAEERDQLFQAVNPDVKVTRLALNSLNTLTEYGDILFNAFVVDNSGIILNSLNEDQFWQSYILPEDTRLLQENVHLHELPSDKQVIEIILPVRDSQARILSRAHLQMDYQSIRVEIAGARWKDLNLAGLVWILGAAGLFLLIYLVMNPFRRLSEWVKELGQPGVAAEMDIDASTEIGEIAKAFSDITQKLRDSQVNLAEQERLQKEMQVAQEIQQTLLPSEFPEVEGYEIASYYDAAKEVGGDYFDFVEVDKDTMGIVVADVSGKGVPGSLVMTMIRTVLRTEARGIKDAAEVLTRVNDFVVNDMKKGMFVTLFYVIIDSKRRRLNYASAGHNPIILFRTSKRKTYYLNPHGFPIGISLPDKNLFKNTIESDTISLAEDDILLIYTDGITEAMNRKRQLFGEERFLNVIRDHGILTANDFVGRLHEEIQSFTEDNPQNDDITLVAIKEKTSAEKLELERAKRAFHKVVQGTSVKESCESEGISTYAYYNKYKEKFEKEGIEVDVVLESEEIEVKHLSIEEKTKLYDVISRFPEYGAKKIREELNKERYGFLEISAPRIYEELVRAHLNTKELREAFISRGGRKKKRLKPPGTPLLTLDGRVIIQRSELADEPQPETRPKRERPVRKEIEPKEVKIEEPESEITVSDAEEMAYESQEIDEEGRGRDILSITAEELFSKPLEEIFDRRQSREESGDGQQVAAGVEEPEMQDESGDEDVFQVDEEVTFEYADATASDLPEEVEDSVVAESGPILQQDEDENIDVPPDKRLRHESEEDELDFAALLKLGEGLEDPERIKEQGKIADGQPIEDARVLSQDDKKETIELEKLDSEFDEPFEEFLEIDDEQGLVNENGELDEEIVEQIVQQEVASRLKSEQYGEKENPEEVVSEVQDYKLPKDTGNRDTAGEADGRLSFDDLIELLAKDNSKAGAPTEIKLHDDDGIPSSQSFSGSKEGTPIGIDSDETLAAAIEFYEAEKFEFSIDEFERFLRLKPNDFRVRVLLGNAYLHSNRYSEAEMEFERVLTADPNNIDACENLGLLYANQGNLIGAINQWEKLLEIAPQRDDIRESVDRAKKFLNGTNGG